MIVSVSAAEFLPYLGFWNRLSRSDMFVIADTARFKHREYQNRNRVRTENGWAWFTVPVHKEHRNAPIKEIKTRPDHDIERSWSLVEANYRGRADFWDTYASEIREAVFQPKLLDVNLALINHVKKWLEIETPIVLASEVTDFKSEDFSLLAMTVARSVEAETYLTGAGNIGILPKRFGDWGIDFLFQEFVNIPYPQVHQGWHPRLSVLDCLLTNGPDYTREITERGWFLP